MPLTISNCKNRLEKVFRICAEFTIQNKQVTHAEFSIFFGAEF